MFEDTFYLTVPFVLSRGIAAEVGKLKAQFQEEKDAWNAQFEKERAQELKRLQEEKDREVQAVRDVSSSSLFYMNAEATL